MAMPASSRDVTWAIVGQAVSATAGIARGILMARVLAPDLLGRLFLLLSLAGLVTIVGPAGVAIVGLRRVAAAGSAGEISGHVRAVARVTAQANAGLIAVAAAGLFAIGVSALEVAAFALFTTTQLWLGASSSLARGLGQVASAVRQELVVVPLAQCAVLGLVWTAAMRLSAADVLAFLAVTAIPSALVVMVPVLRAASPAPSTSIDATTRHLIGESLPVVMNAAAWRALHDVPLWAAGFFVGATGSAIVGVAQRLSTLLGLPLSAMAVALAPRISSAHARHTLGEAAPLLRRGALIATALAAVGFVIIVLIGRRALRMLFGTFFEAAYVPALILGLGQVFNAAAGLGGTALLMIKEARGLLTLSLVSVATLMTACAAVGPRGGLTGLAWA